MLQEFKNETVLDFTRESDRKNQSAALELVQSRLGREYDLIIGSGRIKSPKTFASINPGETSQAIGVFQSGTADQAERAITAATSSFETWKRTPAQQRASLLFKSAELLRARRHECNAWMILEAGKSWVEADADTAEAIDFC